MAYKVYIPQDIDQSGKECLMDGGCEIVMGTGTTPDIMKKEIADCDALLVRTAEIPREVIASGKKLKVISRYGVGYDNIDVTAAKDLGVEVTYSPVGNILTVAEHTIGFIIASAHHFHKCGLAVRTGDWGFRSFGVGTDVAGKTLGLIGIGKIASLVAKKAMLGLDMRVIAFDPYANPSMVPEGVELVEHRETLFRESDFISLHVPDTPATRKSVGAEEFALMKTGAFLINCGRGAVVDEEALIEALKNKQIAGAALDVFNTEPPAAENPLLAMENVIVSPHNAGSTKESAVRVAVDAAQGIVDVLHGRTPRYPVPLPR